MSEYQYYEFQTADRRLSEKEMEKLRSYSTRAQITPTYFANEYSYGDFKGNPNTWMEKYFDGFLYLANWGIHEFQLALPAGWLSAETVRRYFRGESASVREKSGKVILTFLSNEEGGEDWVEGEGILSSLLALRDDLPQGDLRSLYIGWLLSVQNGEFEEGSIEPPVPPNLANLSGRLSDLVEFLRLDPDLLAVAAETSLRQETAPALRQDLAAWVAKLPASEKEEILIRLLSEDGAILGAELRSKFNRSRATALQVPKAPARSAGQLLAAARARFEQRQRAQAVKAVKEKARQEKKAAIARQKHLAALAGQESALWTEIEALVGSRLPKNYDLALQHLIDLRDLASGSGAQSEFSHRLAELRGTHAKKSSWIDRLQANGL